MESKLYKNIVKIINMFYNNNEEKKPLDDIVICLDPGHGLYKKNGSYIYQREEYDGIIEDEITIKVARYLKTRLELDGAEIITTRNINSTEIGKSGSEKWKEGSYLNLKDKGIIPNSFIPYGSDNRDKDINSRPDYANYYHKYVKTVDLLLSLHFNAYKPNVGKGTEVWYYKGNDTTKDISKIILDSTVKLCGTNNRGLKEGVGQYSILRETHMNSIIWEGAFFTHDYDRNNFLKKEEFYRKAARSIEYGIVESKKEGLIS